MLMKRGMDRGYFHKPANSLFILDTTEQEETARREFVEEGLVLNFVSGCIYHPQEELEAWVKPKYGRHGPMGLES